MATVKGGSPRAVIYTRVSTEQQTNNTSLAGQFAACAKRAQDEGAAVYKHYEETQSGGLYQSRGELQKALADIESGQANMLIIYRLDRTGRDVDALRDIRRRVETSGAQLVFADGMSFEKGALGNFMFTQMSAFAELEREVIKERTSAGQQRLARLGKNPNPTAPYGYYIWKKNDVTRGLCTPEQRGTYTINEKEAKWVRAMFQRLGSGQSTRSVVTWLEKEGARTRRGTPWSISSLIYLVENTAYIGRPVWRKNQRILDESRTQRGLGINYDVPRPTDEQYEFQAPPLIDEDTWKQVNEMVKSGRSERSGRNDAKYMLTGFLACPFCGERMDMMHSSSEPEKQVRRHRMYRCPNAVMKKGETTRQCSLPSLLGAGLEHMVVEAISDLVQSPTIMEASIADFKRRQQSDAERNNDAEQLRHIEREIAACRQREEVAATKEIEATISGQDGTVFAQLRDQNAQRRKGLEAEQRALMARSAIVDVVVPEIGRDVATRLVAALHAEQLPAIEKNTLLRPLIKVVYPRLAPPELLLSARRWRARGCQMFPGDAGRHTYARHMGGCDIILRLKGESPAFILSHHLVRWEEGRDENGKTLTPVFETSLRVEEQNPFAMNWKFRSHMETGRFLS